MHKVFVSYRHKNEKNYPIDFDYKCKIKLDNLFYGKYINKSVQFGEYDPDNSAEYIKRLIREEKITDSSVIIVLCGPETWSRKHVDWEIYAGLSNTGGNSGLIGVILPNHQEFEKEEISKELLPKRLVDNIISGYASLFKWDYFINNYEKVIEDAFNNRILKKNKIDNSSVQMKNNKHID